MDKTIFLSEKIKIKLPHPNRTRRIKIAELYLPNGIYRAEFIGQHLPDCICRIRLSERNLPNGICRIRLYGQRQLFFHAEGENKIKSGKSSSLPASISKLKTSFDMGENAE